MESQPPHEKKTKHKGNLIKQISRDFIRNKTKQDQPDEITYSFLHTSPSTQTVLIIGRARKKRIIKNKSHQNFH